MRPITADRGVAVTGEGLHAQQSAQLRRRGLVDSREQRHRLIVTLTAGMLTQSCGADDVSGGDASVDTQGDVRVCDLRSLVG